MMAAVAAMFAASCAVKPIQPVTMTHLSKSESPINGPNQAQGESQSSSENSTNEMSMPFGKNTAFTATAVVNYHQGGGSGPFLGTFISSGLVGVMVDHALNPSSGGKWETQYAFLEGKLRMETDLAQGGPTPKHLRGLLHTIMLICPDKEAASGAHSYLIYPDLRAYLSRTNTTYYDVANLPKTEKIYISRETIKGHPCVKYKEIMTLPNGNKVESIVWRATDLNDFPIKTVRGATFTIMFKNISLSKPPADLFELPVGFNRYESIQEMKLDSLKKK